MPPQNTPQNAGQSVTWSSSQETEATQVSAGYRNALTFVLVPRTSLIFGPADPGAVARLRSLSALFIEVPVKGEARNFELGVTLDCDFSWLVLPEGATTPKAYPVPNAKLVIGQDGKFEIKVDGKAPVLDLVGQRIVNKGKVGYSAMANFPHAEASVFAPAIAYNNPCSVSVQKPQGDACKVGAPVTFTGSFSTVLNQADLELRVVELDEGSSEIASTTGRSAFSHRWGPSAVWLFRGSSSVKWAIGFTDETCEHFSDVGEEEEGSYEFGWQLWGKSRADGPQTLLLEDKEFLRLPKPRLEELRVVYDRSWEGTWEVHGKIGNVDPRARLVVEVALVETPTPPPTPGVPSLLTPNKPAPTAPTVPTRSAPVRVRIDADGVFEAHLGERYMLMPDWTASSPTTPAVTPKGYAILTLPAAAHEGTPGSIAPYLDFDPNKYSPLKADALCWDFDAPWVCSEEAVSLAPRGSRPTRRRSGITSHPAPPVEKGDQKGPMTWDETWQDIIAWEGVVPYMYQDNKGNVTVGAGNLLKYVEPKSVGDTLAAKSLAFQNMDEARAATGQEIKDAFDKVVAMPKKMVYTAYATRPKIALTDAVIKELAKKRFETEFLPNIKKGFPDFDKYPLAARRGIFDVTYNVGISIPLSPSEKWQPFVAAVKARNWAAAATACDKAKPSNGNEDRNTWRMNLFNYAAKVDKKTGS